MSLLKSRELFAENSLPIIVDTVVNRTLLQKDPHRHEYFEMLYVETGELINSFKSDEVQMSDGDVLIMKPYVLHVLKDTGKEVQGKTFCCSFLPQVVDSQILSLEGVKASRSPSRYFFKSFMSLADDGISAVHFKVNEAQRAKLSKLFTLLKETSHDPNTQAIAMTRYHFLGVLTLLAQQHEENKGLNQVVSIDQSVTVSRYKGGLRKTLNHIHNNLSEPLTLEDMAAMCGASSTYFCRLFKHETGMTFLNYMNSLRIEQACVSLMNSSDSAQDICYQVGFNDYTHFGRQFKKHTGMSPASFRKQKQPVRKIRES
ncbi:MAG: AraC family transcriptional regulator [Luteolibacter sp.]